MVEGARGREDVRIVFADIDGTFVDTRKRVPPLNMRALERLVELDVPFVPCTGRPVSAIPQELLSHPATRYVIGANGSVVHDVRMRETFHTRDIDPALVLELYQRVRDLKVTFDVFVDGVVYAPRKRYDAMGSYGIDDAMLEMLRKVRQPVDMDVSQIVERGGHIEKITCFWGDETAREGIERAIASMSGLSVSKGDPKDFEFQAEGVTKGSALLWLCERLGIHVSQSVAFGDEMNDLPLVEAAGWGVAMENGNEAVRAAADDVAPSNDEAGVGVYLLNMLS